MCHPCEFWLDIVAQEEVCSMTNGGSGHKKPNGCKYIAQRITGRLSEEGPLSKSV